MEDKDYNLIRSDREDSYGDSHFKFYNNVMEPHKGFQMFHEESNNCNQTPRVGAVLQQVPEKGIKKFLLDKNHVEFIDLKLRKVILLNIQ